MAETRGGALHALNNQLGIALGMIELVLEDTPPTDPRHADLRTAMNAASQAATIVSDLQLEGDQ